MFSQKIGSPKVSVILLSYNHAAYVSKAIESVLNQTFTDFEFLIADDGSEDNSREIIKTFTDKRINFFLHEKNHGPKTVLAECLKMARGKYIAIHHSDDLWRADKLEKQVDFLENHAEYTACFTWVEIIDENGNSYELSKDNHYHAVFDKENRSREQWLHDLFFFGNCFCHPSAVLRNKKTLYEDLYGTSGLWQLPDYSAWIRLLLKSNLYVLNERLTLFRLRRQKQENTSSERPDTVIRSEMELYRVLAEYKKITSPKEFLKIFPEAKQYVIDGNILPQYALAKLLQTSNGAARRLLALDILFELINNKKTAKILSEWYGYDEKVFVKENADSNIFRTENNMQFLNSSLYFDVGYGFSEKNRLSSMVYVQQDGNFFAEFILNAEKISDLRFDPVENSPISMKINSVKINGNDCNFSAVQPFFEKDGYQIFATYDPKYILHYSGTGNIVLQIKGVISKNYDALTTIAELRMKTEQENRNLQTQSQNLHNRLDETEQAKQILEQKLDETKQENQSLNQRLNESEQENQSLNQRFNESKQENQNLHNQLDENNRILQERSNQLDTIYNSRGYKFLKKYYSLRDKLLPKGSIRRLIVKNIAWAISHPRLAGDLMTEENFSKVLNALKMGGLRQAIVRSDSKIHSLEVGGVKKENDFEYGNEWLKKRESYFPPENIVIDILIPIYNAYDFTKKCLESVYANTDVAFNLYLIDDKSTDERIADLLKEIQNRAKNPLMKNLKILINEENLGFIGSVNRGFKISSNDVVLLNTDTEVPPNWLSRLVKPMLDDEKVASVTPFSNSAEICSFPNFCQNNDLPEGLTVAELDKIFSRYGDLTPCDIPTGVGFCMLMRQQCIKKFGVFDTIYGKGYAEENDWCRRTAAKGYKHVHVKNLFVWHKHGASFSKLPDKSKQQRLNENLAVLSERYPDYGRLVQEYIQEDPARSNRIFINHCAKAVASKNTQGVMFLNHSMGGGAKIYQDRKIDELKSDWRIYEMSPLADGHTLSVVSRCEDNAEHIANFDLRNMDAEQFTSLLEALKINWIFVNQLVTYPMPNILSWIMAANVQYTFFGHDFFAVCPRYQLLNSNIKYCGAETNLAKCRKCLNSGVLNFKTDIDISEWRKNFQSFLDGAKEVIVPSDDTKKIFNKYYSSPVTVKEHEVDKYISYTFQVDFAKNDILTVAVVGAIGDEKGSKIIYKLADELEKTSLKIKLIVIGITNLHNDFYRSPSGKFEITGKYSNKDISNILARHKASIVLIPSIWPETYSYTTTEAMYSGYPVMVFPIGAPADRVRKTDGGWILNDISEESVREKMIELFNDREDIVRKSQNLIKNLHIA